jgi:hypothetical protein
MVERRAFTILADDIRLQIVVGARVSLPTDGRGVGVGIVPDPAGTHIVVCCEADLLEVEQVEEA